MREGHHEHDTVLSSVDCRSYRHRFVQDLARGLPAAGRPVHDQRADDRVGRLPNRHELRQLQAGSHLSTPASGLPRAPEAPGGSRRSLRRMPAQGTRRHGMPLLRRALEIYRPGAAARPQRVLLVGLASTFCPPAPFANFANGASTFMDKTTCKSS